jgi:hypothetical protein
MAQSSSMGWIIGLGAAVAGYLFLKNSYCAAGGSGAGGTICGFFGPSAAAAATTTVHPQPAASQPSTSSTVPTAAVTPPATGSVGVTFTPGSRADPSALALALTGDQLAAGRESAMRGGHR